MLAAQKTMNYYQSDEPIKLREYGRCVQQMVEHIKATPDRDLRTRMAHEAVRSMAILNPASKDMDEFHKKLWDHLYRLAEYDLDVDSPYPAPQPPSPEDKPRRPSYQTIRAKRRHYGQNVERMIEKAKTIENPDARQQYIKQIASYMKLMTRLASTDRNAPDVSDRVIVKHLEEMSGGAIQLDLEATQLVQGFKQTHITNQSAPVYQRRKKKKRQTQAFTQPTSGSGGAQGGGNYRNKRRKKRRNKGGNTGGGPRQGN